MRRRGKRVYVHTDGTMRALLDYVSRLPIDTVEAFTPAPTGDVTLAEVQAAWRGKVIWISSPSSAHLEDSDYVSAVTKDLLHQATLGNGFLLGITEDVPETACARSLAAIADTIEQFGSVRCGTSTPLVSHPAQSVGRRPSLIQYCKELSGGQMVEQTTHTFDLARYQVRDVAAVSALGCKAGVRRRGLHPGRCQRS